MKIVHSNGKATGLRVRCDLARLASRGSQKFLTRHVVTDYLEGRTELDYETSKMIFNADKSISYIERFVRNRVRIDKTDHIVALLCVFSDDSFGSRILSDDFYDYAEELQERLDMCEEHNFNGVLSAVSVMDFLGFSDFLEGKPYDVWFLLYNLFLHKEGLCLILEDTDVPDASLLLAMKYKIETHASKLRA